MKSKHAASVLMLVAAIQVGMPPRCRAQAASSDISAQDQSAPGMEKTTSSRGVRTSGGGQGGAAAAITPAATGRTYTATGDLLIGEGDLLHISVFQAPDFDQDVRVQPSGTVDLAGIGSLEVRDLKPKQVSAKITDLLKQKEILIDPDVTVSITDYISHGVAIQGEIRNPGVYPVIGQRRLSDLLAAGGGPTELSDGYAEVRHAYNGTTEQVQLADSTNSPVIVPGDSIVLRRGPLVYIVGNVRRAGGFPLVRATTLIQGISLAQGLTPSAKDKQVFLFRDHGDGQRVVTQINLHEVLRGKAGDIELKPNDIVFIPNSSAADVLKAAAAALPSIGTALIYTHP